MAPRRIGRYDVLGQLAMGGMAEILLARLAGPGDFARAVVLKRILPMYARDPSFSAMFFDEARIIAKIRHPNVVAVHELGQDGSDVFLVLEYVAGENLAHVLAKSTLSDVKLDPLLAAHVVAEACAGLHAAHELVDDDGKSQNLVHRDVSPQNIFVGYDGHVKLLDFGVARVDTREAFTDVGMVKGKFEYMSPEQIQRRPIDRRSDIFSLGIVLYELTTGRRLFRRANELKTMEAIVKEPIVPPSRVVRGYPAVLEPIVMRALAKDPEARFATASELRRALQDATRELAIPTDTLGARMHAWFPQRIAEKEDMLRRVREGRDVAVAKEPPRGQDVTLVVPGVLAEAAPPLVPTRPMAPAPLPEPASAPRSSAFGFAIAGVVFVVALVSAGIVFVVRAPRAEPNASVDAGSTLAPAVIETIAATPDEAPDGGERRETPVDVPVRGKPAPTAPAVVPTAARAPSRPKPTASPSTPPAPSSGFRRFE